MNLRVGLSSFWREWLRPFLAVAFVLGSFRSAVADWNDVPSGSMTPTILVGDRILVDRRAYDVRVPFTSVSLSRRAEPARGDIVVFESPVDGKLLVKRVAGVPGDTVEVRGLAVVVPPERYFVAGDNRGNSFDSRYWGFLSRDRIRGRAAAVVWSFDREHYYRPRWGRFLQKLS